HAGIQNGFRLAANKPLLPLLCKPSVIANNRCDPIGSETAQFGGGAMIGVDDHARTLFDARARGFRQLESRHSRRKPSSAKRRALSSLAGADLEKRKSLELQLYISIAYTNACNKPQSGAKENLWQNCRRERCLPDGISVKSGRCGHEFYC